MPARTCRRFVVATMATFVLSLIAAGVAHAAAQEVPLAKIARRSQVTVVGRVVSVTPRYVAAGNGRTIETVVRLRVLDALKGEPGRFTTVRVFGGLIGDEGIAVEDSPGFTVGETCVVFLDLRRHVVGWRQGKLAVVDGNVPALERPLAAVKRGIRAAAKGADPAALHPVSEGVRPVTSRLIAPDSSALAAAQAAGGPAGAAPRAHSNLINDGFEGSWGWTTQGSPTWAATTYRKNGGSSSAWCAESTLNAPGPYQDGMGAWMYKTVNLSDATIAMLDFDVWFKTRTGDPWFYALSSDGGLTWGSAGWSGSTNGWWHHQIDLRQAPAAGGGTANYCGRASVIVAFIFQSNSDTLTDEGAYMDNVVLWKDTVAVPSVTGITPGSGSAGTGTSVTIGGSNFGSTQGTVEFYYNGTDRIAAPVTSWSGTSIVCTIPTGLVGGYPGSAASGPIRVTDSNGNWNLPYGFTVTFGYGGVYWSGAAVDYRFNANTSDTSQEETMFDAAWATWNKPALFLFGDAGSCSSTGYPPNSSNGYDDVYWALDPDLPAGGALAVNTYRYSGGFILESDIVFNDNYSWGDGSSSTYDIQSTSTHELGHSLNLRDLYGPGDSSEIMYGYGSAGQVKRTLSADDTAGIVWIYGARPPMVGGMTVDGDAAWTNSYSVTLDSSVTNATQMRFNNDGGTWSGWQAYAASTGWTHVGPQGVRTINAEYKDAGGNVHASSDTIGFDATAPITSDDYSGAPVRSVTITLSPLDVLSGVATTEWRIDGGGWQTGTTVYLRLRGRIKRPGVTPGPHTLDYRSTDNAGNVESYVSRLVTIV